LKGILKITWKWIFSLKFTQMRYWMTPSKPLSTTLALTLYWSLCTTKRSFEANHKLTRANSEQLTVGIYRYLQRTPTVRRCGELRTVLCPISKIGSISLPMSWFKSKNYP
jgi:hypothetical protein